jgi:hypothetical protein
MTSVWYKTTEINDTINRITDYLNNNNFSNHINFKKFKNTMNEDEINKYTSFDKYAYDNTKGLRGCDTYENEIVKFKEQLIIKNSEPKTSDYYYFYLELNDNIIGKANCRITKSLFPSMTFDFLFISDGYTNEKYGKKLFCSSILEISKNHVINKIQAQTLPSNFFAIKILDSFGFTV